MDAAHLDFETRSRTDLRKSGVYRYTEDPTTGVWCFAWRIGVGEFAMWTPEHPDPIPLLNHIAAGGTVVAHNAVFERQVWNDVLLKIRPHWPRLAMEQQDCTMARAAAVSHPQDLDTLCRAVHSEEVKDREGHALMLKMSRPRKMNADGTVQWWDEPENIKRLLRYCEQDVRTECEVETKIPYLTPYEKEVWKLDQRINDRGICIDVKAVEKCVTLVELAKKSADSEMRRLTDRWVPKCSNDAKLIEWVQQRGIDCTTVKKGVQDDLIFMAGLNDDKIVVDVIKLRADSKKTSTAKYAAMMECVCADGRVRGTLNYHGAGPGRWAGRLIQPQNFPRVDHKKEGHIFNWLSELLDSDMNPKEVFDMLVAVHGESGDHSPLRLLSRFLRSTIVAAPGNKLVGGDFANIEGRVNAWLAGEAWKLKAFEEYDQGTGPDLYKLSYARSFGIPIEAVDGGSDSGPQRQIGKVQELALGYQGGVGAYLDMGPTYGVNPYDLTKPVMEAAPARQWDLTAAQYKDAKNKEGLQEREWTAIKILVDNWRAANPAITQSWWDIQDAAVEAVSIPGTYVKVLGGRITYYSDSRCLWCILPSGRAICYAYPEIKVEKVVRKNKMGEEYETWKRTVTFWGYKEGQWRKLSLYGGLQCENYTQGTARCFMVHSMFLAEAAGYMLILTVHDELLAEVAASRGDLNDRDFERIMSTKPEWGAGLPLAAKAWQDMRYIK